MMNLMCLDSRQHEGRTIHSLLDDVLRIHQKPEDIYEIAAILESLGWNDDRVAKQFGVAGIFELAEILWEGCKTRIFVSRFAKTEAKPLWQITLTLVRQFLRGVIFAIPMAISVFCMLTLKFSLWSFEHLSVELATSIAVGTILSFVTVGGFTQGIARRGFFYIIQGYYEMAKKITFRFIFFGFVVCALLCVLLFALNLIIHMFTFHMLLIIIFYFFFLNSIWLSVTVMYILRKELLFTGLIILGIFIVYVLFVLLNMNIIFSQLIALAIVSAISMLFVMYLFKRAERKEEKGISPELPKMSVLMYSTMPYFVYGFLYFAFLFLDRMIAWTRNNDFMPYLIWFRGEYELGLDFSLLVLILPMGISEVILTKMMMDVETAQKGYWADETERMNQIYLRKYGRQMLQIFAVAFLCAYGLYWALLQLGAHSQLFASLHLFNSPVTKFVFIVSLIAYVFIAVALMNAVLLFSLSQPGFVVRAIWISILANLIVGFLLSRWIDYHYAVIGLLIGSGSFLVLTSRQVIRVLGNLDYYLYAAV
ncbi:MAG TPA: hypothetical protein VF260_00995 [Bacilli bacterium]